MEFPSHDGDDIAVVSLRDDLLGPGGQCVKPSHNLLTYSSDLRGGHLGADAAGAELVHGWQLRRCTLTDETCLELALPSTLTPVSGPPPNTAGGSGTWLLQRPLSEITDPDDLDIITSTPAPAGIVFQRVTLSPGTYTLSWWDQARQSAGVPTTPLSGEVDYAAQVYDAAWFPVATSTHTPHRIDVEDWSSRRAMPVTITTAGDYYVAFGASLGGFTLGSVVISGVQLEQGSAPTAYQDNGSSTLMPHANCAAGSVEQFQKAFTYKCDGQGQCAYELTAPFSISSFALDSGASNLVGKLAKDNFNYRHITVGLNFVGTGVLDCATEGTPSCYGSGFAEYTLEHTAFDVQVLNHKRAEFKEGFNFGLASLNRAKALAAERFITLPIGSADSALLAQPAFEKHEYRGRPIDGSYRLKIFDKPSLRWNQIEDIQFVLRYRYWSRIQPYATGN